VRTFVRDMPRSHVVPVEAVMSPLSSAEYAGDVAAGTKVRDVVKLLASSQHPVRVMSADHQPIGEVTQLQVLSVIAGEEL